MWFQKAAAQGDAAAQYETGVSYATGAGTAKNDAEAAKWFRRAADQGMPYAQLNLGLLYASGRGVPQDNVEAMTWLQLALFALPPGGARFDVARAMEDVSKNMTSEQREDAREHARVWKARPETK
jgi:TPR repeat protein